MKLSDFKIKAKRVVEDATRSSDVLNVKMKDEPHTRGRRLYYAALHVMKEKLRMKYREFPTTEINGMTSAMRYNKTHKFFIREVNGIMNAINMNQ